MDEPLVTREERNHYKPSLIQRCHQWMTPATYIYRRTEVATLGPDNKNLNKVGCRMHSTEHMINYQRRTCTVLGNPFIYHY